MSRINRVVRQKEVQTKHKKEKKKKKRVIPVYDMDGHTITPEKKKREKRLALLILTLSAIAIFIYFPGFFMEDAGSEDSVTVTPDSSAIRLSNSALRDNPQEDFDGDGLTNTEEINAGTNPWNADTDGDGATDYFEVKVSDTDPLTENDLLEDMQTKMDRNNEKNVGSPYKIGNVILWADNYEAKSHGSVVETVSGYRFHLFSGYAQFPENEGKYAYKVERGIRTLLPYRENENAWQIEGDMTVELYDEPLEKIVEFNFFFHPVYAPSNMATDLLSKILPDKGFITAEQKMKIDVEPDTRDNTVIDIKKPIFDSTDSYRFTLNSNTLNDLLFVRETIKEEECCVAVSLFHEEYGEYLAIVYGYTYDGDLLLADMNTLEPIGVLSIEENARKIIDDTGSLLSMSYFDFSGFGFDSRNGDRISFFAASASSLTGDQPSGFGKETDKEKEESEEEKGEAVTEDKEKDEKDKTKDAEDATDGQDPGDNEKEDTDNDSSTKSQETENTEEEHRVMNEDLPSEFE